MEKLLIFKRIFSSRKLEFLTQYDPTKIAVINIKDLDGVRNAINIITPDGSKILQCVTVAAKVSEQFAKEIIKISGCERGYFHIIYIGLGKK